MSTASGILQESRDEFFFQSYFFIRQRNFDLSVDSSWSNERRVQAVDSVRGQNYPDIIILVKAIQLVQKFQHRPLDLLFSI